VTMVKPCDAAFKRLLWRPPVGRLLLGPPRQSKSRAKHVTFELVITNSWQDVASDPKEFPRRQDGVQARCGQASRPQVAIRRTYLGHVGDED
jgi:hypothetical protein